MEQIIESGKKKIPLYTIISPVCCEMSLLGQDTLPVTRLASKKPHTMASRKLLTSVCSQMLAGIKKKFMQQFKNMSSLCKCVKKNMFAWREPIKRSHQH